MFQKQQSPIECRYLLPQSVCFRVINFDVDSLWMSLTSAHHTNIVRVTVCECVLLYIFYVYCFLSLYGWTNLATFIMEVVK